MRQTLWTLGFFFFGLTVLLRLLRRSKNAFPLVEEAPSFSRSLLKENGSRKTLMCFRRQKLACCCTIVFSVIR